MLRDDQSSKLDLRLPNLPTSHIQGLAYMKLTRCMWSCKGGSNKALHSDHHFLECFAIIALPHATMSRPGPSSSVPSPTDTAHASGSSSQNSTAQNRQDPSATAVPAPHPLLPPIGGTARLEAEIDPYAEFHAFKEHQRQTAVPEKCLTFCSQRADAPPMCRMFCLRRRQLALSQAEELARLRAPSRNVEHASTRSMEQISPAPSSSAEPTSFWSAWSPFEALRRKLAPYSFIYVRGTPEGIVGRYMEELEYDDGYRDFGTISRGTDTEGKRKREVQMEWLEWGANG